MKGVWYKSHDDVFASGEDKFFVAREVGSAKKDTREFSSHATPIDFYNTYIKDAKKPSFHELIPSWRARRVHFDIDADVVLQDISEFIGEILHACNEELTTHGLELNPDEVIVLDSSSQKKTSIHVILSTILTSSPSQCKEFYKSVTYKLRRSIHSSRYDYVGEYLDDGIYQRNRCFRLPFCTKKGQERYLLPVDFVYDGKSYTHGRHLPKEVVYAMAVIGVVEPTSVMKFVEYNIVEETGISSIYQREIDQQEETLILDIVQRHFTRSEWVFEVRKRTPGNIELNRTHPGPCRVCRKIHDKEHAKLRVTNDGRISFVCWRKEDEPLYIDRITRVGENGPSNTSVQGDVSKRYLDLPHHPDVARTSEDYISFLIGKFGHIE